MQQSALWSELSLYSLEKQLIMFRIFINLNFGVQMDVKNTITQPFFGTTTIQMIYLPNLKAVKLTLMEFISRQKKDIVLQLIQN